MVLVQVIGRLIEKDMHEIVIVTWMLITRDEIDQYT